jgi:hypothetical protein
MPEKRKYREFLRHRAARIVRFGALVAISAFLAALAASGPQDFDNLTNQTLEDLMNIRQATDRCSQRPGYAFKQVHRWSAPSTQDIASVMAKQRSSSPDSAQLRSHFILLHGLACAASAYFAGPVADPREASLLTSRHGDLLTSARIALPELGGPERRERLSGGIRGGNCKRKNRAREARGLGKAELAILSA